MNRCFLFFCRLVLFSALLVVCAEGRGQRTPQKPTPVVVKGNASFAAGKEIRLIVFEDLLTYRPRVAATAEIAADGSFQLSYSTLRPELVQIAIQTSKAEFYVQPASVYDFTIEMDEQLFDLLDPMSYGGFLQVTCRNELPENDINQKISYFDNYADAVVDDYAPNNIGDMTQPQYDSIDSVLHHRFPIEYQPTSFYKSYLFYSFGSIERIWLQKQPDSLYHKYLDNEYVLYDNPAYMNFFHEFYRNYLLSSPRINRIELEKSINEDGTFLGVFNFLGKDAFLVNERLRELVMIDNLLQLYGNERFSKKNVVSLLREMANNSHFEEHRRMASNALETVEHFSDGNEISFPHLKEASGADFDPKTLRGKWVYIQFFSSECADCIREMMIISQLKAKYGDQIEFVSISVDFNFGHFIHFMEQYPMFDWHFVHFNSQFAWLDELQVATLPDNLLLNPDGTLAQRYAPDITRKLSVFLARLFKPTDDGKAPLDPHGKK